MKMDIRNKVLELLSIAVIIFTVAGCGKEQEGVGLITRLEVYYSGAPRINAFLKESFNQFEEEHPGIKIKASNIPASYYMVLQTRFASNTAPDIIYLQNKSLADYVDRGVLLNLKEYIDKDNYDISDICRLGFEEGGITEEKIYGIPVTGTPEVLIYNKDLFDKTGLTYPDEIWTLKELLEAAKELTRDTNGDGRIDQIGILVSPGWWAADFATIWAGGGDIFNEDMTRCIVDSPQAEEAIQFQIDLINKYKVALRGTMMASEGKDGIEAFMSGRVAMLPELPFVALSKFSQCKNLNWDLTLMPKGKAGRIVRYTGECWVISKSTKYPEESWELAKFLASPEIARGLAKLNKIPARLSILNSPYFIKPETPYQEEVIVKSLKYARAIPSLRNIEEIGSIWERQMQLAILEKITVKEALKNIEKKVNNLLLKK
jgi:multiple sugar transport system substrate-binding protein